MTDTGELFGIADHICTTSEELATAFDDAEANSGVTIQIGKGVFTPFDYKSDSQPWSLSPSTTIMGQMMGEATGRPPDTSGHDVLDPTSGTRIDAAGNSLWRGDDVSGLHIENLCVLNHKHVLVAGEPLTNGSYTGGIHLSVLRNLWGEGGTDYMLKLFNTQMSRFDQIISSSGAGVLHYCASTDKMQPGNSVFTHIFSQVEDDPGQPLIYLEARDISLNYLTIIRPQTFPKAHVSAPAVKMEGNPGAAVNSCRIINGDFEGHTTNYLDMSHASNNVIEAEHNNLADGTEFVLDSVSSNNHIMTQKGGVVDCSNGSNRFSGRFDGFVGGQAGYGLVNNTSNDDLLTEYLWYMNENKRVAINAEDIVYNARAITADHGFMSQDINLGLISGKQHGRMRYHNGNDGTQEDWYRWDSTTSQWIRVGDTSTTITP